MIITLKNDVHNTKVNLRIKKYGDILSPYQIRRSKSILCGMNDCFCSNDLGIRGEQFYRIEEEFTGKITYSIWKD